MNDGQLLKRELTRAGWTSRPGKGTHEVFKCPCGEHQATLMKDYSPRNFQNARSQLRRTGCPYLPKMLQRDARSAGKISESSSASLGS